VENTTHGCWHSSCDAQLVSYGNSGTSSGAEARAVSYIQIKTERGLALYGAGIDTNIELASIKAIVSALNRALAK
jgi:2-isopropylmalate synthase